MTEHLLNLLLDGRRKGVNVRLRPGRSGKDSLYDDLLKTSKDWRKESSNL